MTAFSNYTEDEVLDHIGGSAWTAPTGLWLGLFYGDPGETATGIEVVGSGYARQQLTMSTSSGGSIENTVDVVFTASGGGWGTIPYAAVWETEYGGAGNMIWYEALTTSKTVNDTDTLTFASGQVTLSLD